MVIKKVLNNLNIACDEAENGQISVDLHKEGKQYDLILMDKEMPVMDGHEVSRLFLFVEMLLPTSDVCMYINKYTYIST